MGVIVAANFWGFFWAIILLAIGIKMLVKRGSCPMCGLGMWHGKMHGKMNGECCGGGCDHDAECKECDEEGKK